MYKTILFLILAISPLFLLAQQQDETLFRNSRVRGGFISPIFSWSHANGKTGYGAGGGLGVVFDNFFIGLYGMGETFDAPKSGPTQLVLGHGGLWAGYHFPSHRLVHLYTSLKVGGGGTGTTDFDDDWDFDDNWEDATLVIVPEAGLELNVARWMRLSGTVGYRFVEGFDGWGNYGKNDLNAPVFALTLRLGWFSGKQK